MRNAPIHATLISLLLCAAAANTACSGDAVANTVTPSTVAASASRPADGALAMQAQPPYDETPITPVETAGAARGD